MVQVSSSFIIILTFSLIRIGRDNFTNLQHIVKKSKGDSAIKHHSSINRDNNSNNNKNHNMVSNKHWNVLRYVIFDTPTPLPEIDGSRSGPSGPNFDPNGPNFELRYNIILKSVVNTHPFIIPASRVQCPSEKCITAVSYSVVVLLLLSLSLLLLL